MILIISMVVTINHCFFKINLLICTYTCYKSPKKEERPILHFPMCVEPNSTTDPAPYNGDFVSHRYYIQTLLDVILMLIISPLVEDRVTTLMCCVWFLSILSVIL